MTAEHLNCDISGYRLLEKLSGRKASFVYRAVSTLESDENLSPVIIKILVLEGAVAQDVLRFRHQYEITKDLGLPGIIHPHQLLEYSWGPVLVMEDFGGISLAQYQSSCSLSLPEFFNIGTQLASILYELHQRRIIHKDIKPSNILINPNTQQVKLIDFGIASILPRETPEILSPNLLEGTLAYLSPEQTGRMNRGIDYRTDFYALGVTFYELLTGMLPFQSDDALELIYCHLAQSATLVDQVQPSVPVMVAQIVAKLMAKNVEDRYQSAWGLYSDLEQCWNQWKKNGAIEIFELGQHDLSDRFLIPEKLYGRTAEVQTLLSAFDRVAQGSTELILIAGFSGIGKTAVVNEVHKPIVRQRGYFIKGKFDQFNRDIPLSAFIQALRNLIKQLLSESDEQLAQWQAQIMAAVGENGQVLIDVIPELVQIIGQQSSVLELSGSAAQNRFNLLFHKFIAVFTTANHPLVIFLDDLQWADSASLQLMQILMKNSNYLLILGAYRDNEVSFVHPLMLMLKELNKSRAIVHTIQLAPLTMADTNNLVADTLHCSPSLAQPLAELIDRTTQGNPFFTTQFLKSLYEDGYVCLNTNKRYWECDIDRVKALSLNNDVLEFMVLQSQKLPAITQQVLQLAACIGNQFDLDTLSIISEQPSLEITDALWSALQAGLVLPISQGYQFFQDQDLSEKVNPHYQFLHDRFQQAAYSLIPEQQKPSIHLKIGQLLLDNAVPEKQDEYLFEIVNHLNRGAFLLDTRQEQEHLAQLNLKAGRKAKLSNAYQSAITYFAQGIQLLPKDSWEIFYSLSLALHQEITEASYLNSDFEQVEKWSQVVCQSTKIYLDTIKVQQNRILALNVQGKMREALNVGLNLLQSLGLDFPQQPTSADVAKAFAVTKALWAEQSIDTLEDLATLTNPLLLSQMEVLSTLSSTAYVVDQALMSLLIFKQVEISISLGNCPTSVFTYGDYGVILCGIVGDIENGYAFGELAIRLRERWQLSCSESRNLFVVNSFVKHWKIGLSQIVPTIEAAYQSGMETGDLESAHLNAQLYCNYGYYQGQPLAVLLPKIIAYRQSMLQHEHLYCLSLQSGSHQAVLNLLGNAQNCDQLAGDIFDINTALSQMKANNYFTGVFHCCVNQIILYYLFDKNDEANHFCAQAVDYLHDSSGTFGIVLYSWFDALVQLRRYPGLPPEEQQAILEQVEQQQEKLRHWAKFAPTNHQHRWELVIAEKNRVEGKQIEAIEYYDRAIESAKANEFIQDQALANELAAKFCLAWGKEKFAAIYMQEAYDCYHRWGAKAKTDDLEDHYPQLLTNKILAIQSVIAHQSASIINDSIGNLVKLDLSMLFKAAQAISGEIELPKLLATLLNITLNNAGADKVVLLLQSERELKISALLQAGQQPQILIPGISLGVSPDVSISVVNSVKRSWEPLILGSAKDYGQFEGDAYLQQHQPQSILCSPILNQGKFLGILYLENNLTSNVFTRDRLDVLTILCSQAAIALENSRLFNLEQDKARALQFSLDQLQQSELRFQNLFEKSKDAIMLLDDGGFLDCNQAAIELFGYTEKSQVLNLRPFQISPEFQPDGQSSLAKSDLLIAQAFSSGGHQFEWMHQRLNNETFWAEVVLTPILFEETWILHAIVRDISDRKSMEAALMQSEARYSQLASNIPAALYQFEITAEGVSRLNYISSRFYELFEIKVAEALADISVLFNLILPADQESFYQSIQDSATSRLPWTWEGRWLLPSGKIKWVRGDSIPKHQPDGSIIWDGILTDINDRKTAENKLEFTQFAVDNSADGIAWVRPNGSFAYGNQAMCQMLGYSFDEFCQLYVWDVDHSGLVMSSAWPAHWQHLKNLGSLTIESEHHDKKGNYYPVELSMSYFEFAGEEYNFIQARNITERKQAEVKLVSTIHDLQQATRLKDEFLATMSHELRTPLNAILGMSEVLQEEVLGEVNERQRKSLCTIERSGRHLLSLINDILDVSKISAGKLELNIQTVDIHKLVNTSLALIRPQAHSKSIRLECLVSPTIGAMIVDERRMRQVLLNLLSNAVKFTAPNGLVTLSVTRQDGPRGYLEFAVADTGIGIAPEDCDKLFEPFVQLDSNLNRQYEGTGLGLTLVRQIVELHGGSIHLESELDHGSCFMVVLPSSCLVTKSVGNHFDPYDSLDFSDNSKEIFMVRPTSILLAEDNESNIETFASYLTAQGYQLYLAANGNQAIEIAQREKPNLILMDIQMPEMDGIQAITYLRQDPQLRNTPIIALTALVMAGDQERCLEVGANDYLSKPVKLKQLHQTIQYWLEHN